MNNNLWLMQGDCPLWEEEQLVVADRHIKFLEWHITSMTRIVDIHISRGLSSQECAKMASEDVMNELIKEKHL